MSTTYSFYFKSNDNKFYPLDSFGGSSNVGQAMDAKFGRNFAYCKRKPITKAELKEVADFEHDQACILEKENEGWRQRQRDIGAWNNTIDEKRRAIADIDDAIDENNDEIDCCRLAKSFFDFLIRILEEASFSCESETDENVDADKYIYWEVS